MKNVVIILILFLAITLMGGCRSDDIVDNILSEMDKQTDEVNENENNDQGKNESDNGIDSGADNGNVNDVSGVDAESDKNEVENDQQSNDTVEVEPHKYFVYNKNIPISEDSEGDEDTYYTYLYDLTDYKLITDFNRSCGFQRDTKGRLLLVKDGNLCILDPSGNEPEKIIDKDVVYFKANKDFSKIIYQKWLNDHGQFGGYYIYYCSLYYYNTIADEKFYIGDMVESDCLVSNSFETIYYADSNMRLTEWNLEKGSNTIEERNADVFYNFIEKRNKFAFIDENDILYYFQIEDEKYVVYRKVLNRNPEKILSDINIQSAVINLENGSMYLEKKVLSRFRNIPLSISAVRFEELIEEMEKVIGEKKAKEIASRYRKLNAEYLSELDSDDRDEIVDRYPEVLNEDIYVLRDNLKDRVKEEIEEAFDSIGFDIENDTSVYGTRLYVEGSEIYYYNSQTAPAAELIYKTENSTSIRSFGDSHLTIRITESDKEGNRINTIIVDGKKVRINEDISTDIESLSGHEGADFIEILCKDKVFTINNISGFGELTYTVKDCEDWNSYFDTNRITMGDYKSVSFDYYDDEMFFNIGTELYVNDEQVDDGVLKYISDLNENKDQKAFIYLKRIPITEYELSYYNTIHKNILMYYDNGNITEICRDVSAPTLSGDLIVFIKRFPDEEYLGELCVWDKNTNSIRIIDSGISSYFMPLWAEIEKKCISYS